MAAEPSPDPTELEDLAEVIHYTNELTFCANSDFEECIDVVGGAASCFKIARAVLAALGSATDQGATARRPCPECSWVGGGRHESH